MYNLLKTQICLIYEKKNIIQNPVSYTENIEPLKNKKFNINQYNDSRKIPLYKKP